MTEQSNAVVPTGTNPGTTPAPTGEDKPNPPSLDGVGVEAVIELLWRRPEILKAYLAKRTDTFERHARLRLLFELLNRELASARKDVGLE